MSRKIDQKFHRAIISVERAFSAQSKSTIARDTVLNKIVSVKINMLGMVKYAADWLKINKTRFAKPLIQMVIADSQFSSLF
jgi:hypothetical protein